MFISDKRATNLYYAISDPIMELRCINNAEPSVEEMDELLFKLQLKIADNIKEVLNLKTYRK